MKNILLVVCLFAFTQCAPTNPVKIAGYEELTGDDEIKYSDIPCHTDAIVHAADTFDQRQLVNAYRLHNNQGYLLRFKDRKGDEKLTYLVEMDSICSVTRVTTAFPMERE
jgi:hypothetical protein